MCHDDATEGWQCGRYSCPSVHEDTNVDRRIEVLPTLEGGSPYAPIANPITLALFVRLTHRKQSLGLCA